MIPDVYEITQYSLFLFLFSFLLFTKLHEAKLVKSLLRA